MWYNRKCGIINKYKVPTSVIDKAEFGMAKVVIALSTSFHVVAVMDGFIVHSVKADFFFNPV